MTAHKKQICPRCKVLKARLTRHLLYCKRLPPPAKLWDVYINGQYNITMLRDKYGATYDAVQNRLRVGASRVGLSDDDVDRVIKQKSEQYRKQYIEIRIPKCRKCGISINRHKLPLVLSNGKPNLTIVPKGTRTKCGWCAKGE